MSQKNLRRCPTCGGKAENLGLRDYQWMEGVLPSKVGLTDLDAVLQQDRTGRILALEFKHEPHVPKGQKILFDALTKAGWDVWLIVDADPDALLIRSWGTNQWRSMSTPELKQAVLDWWNLGLA